MKRIGMGGPTMGTLILAMLLLRWGAPGLASQSETAHAQERLTPSSQGPQNVRENKTKWPEDGPWKASRQHFAGRQPDEQCPSLKAAPRTLDDPHRDVWCIPAGVQVRAMIAIAPDPAHSHLSLVFDRTIEALQLSAESMGYVVDRYWLPWQPDLRGSRSQQAEGLDTTEKEKQPGLLLFRWNGPADTSRPEVLYVFLVSDTSTAGINGTQFRNAVEYVRQVRGVADKGPIWIMGPTFSGSLASLRALTTPWKNLHFTAYSGTVSSMCAIANQGLLDSSSEPCGVKRPDSPPNLKFRSLISDSETVVKKFLDALKENREIRCGSLDSSEVAIFSEAATTYGGVGKEDSCYTSFRYPREISSLRNASASSEPAAAVSPQTGVVSVPTYLPFNLADRQPNASDEPPDFARVQGPLSKEAVLMKYAAELRRGHYKYAGIIGTNVVDVLFLARFLRKLCPDVRLFVLDSDLLFERDRDNAPYIGMLSLSTYPLVSRNLEWTFEQERQRLPFADEYQEGQYNAALLVMQHVLPPRPPALEPQPFEVSEPFVEPARPFIPGSSILPVWMTAVGTGGYWPVEVIPPQPGPSQSPAQLAGHDFSPAWRTIALLLEGFAFLQSLVLLTVKPVAARFRDFALVNPAPAQRFFFINVASAGLAFTLAIFSTPAWKFGMGADHHVPAIATTAAIAIGALFLSSLYLARLFHKIRGDELRPNAERRYRLSLFFSAVVWLLAALGEWCWWGLHSDDATHYGFFFGYRASNLATGVSPLMPMLPLLSALFLWAIFEIWRLRFYDEVRPRLGTTNYFPGESTEAPVARSINRYLLRGNYLAIFLVLFVGWFFSFGLLHPFQLFEKSSYGFLYGVLFCLTVGLMLASSLRLAQTWSELHKLLHDLERSPIRRAFTRLKLGSWSPIWQSGGQEEEWNNMVRSFEVMQEIRNCDETLDPELAKSIKSALDTRDAIRRKVRPNSVSAANADGAEALSARLRRRYNRIKESAWEILTCESIAGFRKVDTMFGRLQASLAVVLNDMLRILESHWETDCSEPDDEEFSKEEKPVVIHSAKETPDPQVRKMQRLERYVALRYVAFIRAVLGHIRLWLILQAAVFSLVLLSLNVYSFEPHRTLIWSFIAIFVFLGAIAIHVLMQAHRDPVISRITGNRPNELGLHFYLRVATLGVVPLLTLLATQFPSISRYLLSFLQPGLETLK